MWRDFPSKTNTDGEAKQELEMTSQNGSVQQVERNNPKCKNDIPCVITSPKFSNLNFLKTMQIMKLISCSS
jgi:hypothetical protein